MSYIVAGYTELINEKCTHCTRTLEEHYAASYPYPHNYCPGPGRGNWKDSPGTCFKPSGVFKDKYDKA